MRWLLLDVEMCTACGVSFLTPPSSHSSLITSPFFILPQVSFVNSICTTKGGQHVNYIADQIAEAV